MSKIPHILAFSGSARVGSFNQTLVTIASEAAQRAGADVKLISLGDYTLPLFNEDLEKEGTPTAATELKALFKAADGLLIATPEYNSTVTPLFKNALDWVSRPAEGEEMLAAFAGKSAALLSASPGGYGGARALKQVRELLGNIKVNVIDESFSLPKAHEAFDDLSKLTDAEVLAKVDAVSIALVKHLAKIAD